MDSLDNDQPLFDNVATAHVSYDTIQAFVKKRVATFDYICRLHEGNANYLSTVHLSSETLAKAYDDKTKLKRRVTKLFHLGYAVGALLVIGAPADFLRAFSQLMSEYEHEKDENKATQKMVKHSYT